MIGETINEDNIRNMTEDTFIRHNKKMVKKAAFKKLNEIKESHSKVRENKYKKLEAQQNIVSS